MTQWFGKSWGAPACDPDLHAPTPVGEECWGRCGKVITADDQGVMLPYYLGDWQHVPYHLDCFLHEVGVAPCTHQD